MIETILISISVIMMVAGAFFSFFAALGILRLPDVYSRAHASGKASTLGVMLILTGVLIYFIGKDGHFNVQLLLGIIFIFITGPLAGHLVSRSAYYMGVKPTDRTLRDDLKDAK
ncbi:monovalent cation/H(+) antiporter subunit G [Mammaliicoccus stepanovicii]|uniref:Monovalent cation/H+ antiporter subunit G n=1 Tax=Mammaliicoccus stepanovicii TaxID=643214 RepID=A0A239ZUR0_9STAP|nr:monovalent cation/H(+) antiporter subunit G [Mammaliicoccus stepanovicii]PNZ77500.1 Na+/H+ antiporter subunit G [Mammaliicoccus stepanovicii]GGI38939.1 Na(+)/H(+) antiporter subunit G1 [Mammaliicoccus stepanovicii]SNV74503.1 monovalent cation/H+ antiporter subunit G [Mammaliicoccus stepanovicii]